MENQPSVHDGMCVSLFISVETKDKQQPSVAKMDSFQWQRLQNDEIKEQLLNRKSVPLFYNVSECVQLFCYVLYNLQATGKTLYFTWVFFVFVFADVDIISILKFCCFYKDRRSNGTVEMWYDISSPVPPLCGQHVSIHSASNHQ